MWMKADSFWNSILCVMIFLPNTTMLNENCFWLQHRELKTMNKRLKYINTQRTIVRAAWESKLRAQCCMMFLVSCLQCQALLLDVSLFSLCPWWVHVFNVDINKRLNMGEFVCVHTRRVNQHITSTAASWSATCFSSKQENHRRLKDQRRLFWQTPRAYFLLHQSLLTK